MFVYDKPFDPTTTTRLQLEKHKVYRGFPGISMFPMQNQENATSCGKNPANKHMKISMNQSEPVQKHDFVAKTMERT